MENENRNLFGRNRLARDFLIARLSAGLDAYPDLTKHVEVAFELAERFITRSNVDIPEGDNVPQYAENNDEVPDHNSFMDRKLLNTTLERIAGLLRYSLGPTRDVKTRHLQEALALVKLLLDAQPTEERKETTDGLSDT